MQHALKHISFPILQKKDERYTSQDCIKGGVYNSEHKHKN